MTSQLNVSVLVAARDEYSDQLKRHLTPLIQEGFSSIYEDSIIEDESNPLKQFQLFLKQVPKWNQSILDQETVRIKEKCPYLMDMVTAIFVSHVKILASVRLGGSHSNIKIKIPTIEIFIHSVYVAGAECFYYDPEPFTDLIDRTNVDKIKETIESNIDDTISSMIPIQNILQEYLCNTFTDHVKPKISEPVKDNDIGDILSGSDILEPTEPKSDYDSGNDSDNSDLSELFSQESYDNTEGQSNSSDTIFPIGDEPVFTDKIKEPELDDLGLDDLNLDDNSVYNDEPKVIDTEPSTEFLNLGDESNESNESNDSKDILSDTIDMPDFTDSIPLEQDNMGFNDKGGDPVESDFNFFDNDDIL